MRFNIKFSLIPYTIALLNTTSHEIQQLCLRDVRAYAGCVLGHGKRNGVFDRAVVGDAARMKISDKWEHEFIEFTVYPSYLDFEHRQNSIPIIVERDFDFFDKRKIDPEASGPKVIPATDRIRIKEKNDFKETPSKLATTHFPQALPFIQAVLLVRQVTESLGSYHLTQRNCYQFSDTVMQSLSLYAHTQIIHESNGKILSGFFHGFSITPPQDPGFIQSEVIQNVVEEIRAEALGGIGAGVYKECCRRVPVVELGFHVLDVCFIAAKALALIGFTRT